MSVTCTLTAFVLKHTFDQSADTLIDWLGNRFTDHSQILPKALGRANDRAWQAVGLALAGDGLVDKVKDLFRDRDLTAAREAIRGFLANTPTGLEMSPAGLRVRACDELNRLRRLGRLTAPHDRKTVVADLTRFGNTGRMVGEAAEAVAIVADGLAADAPNLAQILRLAPPGGPPLLVTAFLFFLRREVETNDELAHGLTFDSLRQLTVSQDRGFALLDGRTEGILDQIGLVFDELATLRKEMREWQESNRVVTVTADTPIGVSVSNERELARLRTFRDRMRNLPPEIVESADWQNLGADLDAGGLFAEAWSAHQSAAAKAKANADRATEAENEFRAFKDACETGKWAEAKESLARAVRLDPRRFQPFDRSRYRLDAILGVGGFGTVFRCLDTEDVDDDGNPVVVAVKSLRGENLDRDPRVVFAEARTLRDLYRPGSRLIRVIGWGYAYADPDDPDRKERPYIVMEYFPGETLEAIVNRSGPLAVPDFLTVARQIVEAFREAHTRNVYHRDLKPSNVMARRLAAGTWDVRVIDFGLAVRYESAYRASMNHASGRSTERDRSLTGSLDFAPPEQRGKLPGVRVGPYSDVYAFGKTCLWLLFRTTDPKGGHWKRIPEEVRDPLRELLEAATAEELTPDPAQGEHQVLRLPTFDPIAEALATLDPTKRDRQEREAAERKRQTEETERSRVEAETARKAAEERDRAEADRLRQEVERLRQEQAEQQRAAEAERVSVAAEAARREAEERNQAEADRIRLETERIQREQEDRERTERDRQREDENRRKAERKQQEAETERQEKEARKKATAKAMEEDPFNPAMQRSAGDKIAITLPGKVPMAFAWCPPGTFMMGGNVEDDEKSDRRVTLTKGFYMAIHPVTQTQWEAITGETPSHFKGKKLPVEQVSWDDCQEFCQKLTDHLKGRVTVRLPSEAEWEYACRAGTTTEYHTGDDQEALRQAGWYDGNSRHTTHSVGGRAPNAWGLYDMHGNVWEWCQDGSGPYPAGPRIDPKGRKTGSIRVLRGGGWGSIPRDCCAGYRHGFGPADRSSNFGCRVCFCLE
jgi:formylglycine-generating enzyme required for sulfatase activity